MSTFFDSEPYQSSVRVQVLSNVHRLELKFGQTHKDIYVLWTYYPYTDENDVTYPRDRTGTGTYTRYVGKSLRVLRPGKKAHV